MLTYIYIYINLIKPLPASSDMPSSSMGPSPSVALQAVPTVAQTPRPPSRPRYIRYLAVMTNLAIETEHF